MCKPHQTSMSIANHDYVTRTLKSIRNLSKSESEMSFALHLNNLLKECLFVSKKGIKSVSVNSLDHWLFERSNICDKSIEIKSTYFSNFCSS